MTLGIEEWFAVAHIHDSGMLEIVHGQVVKVLLGAQHVETSIVRFEEGEALLGRVERVSRSGLDQVVGRLQLFDGGVDLSRAFEFQRHPVPLGEFEAQFGEQGSFDVQVQFDLGEGGDEDIVTGEEAFSGCLALVDRGCFFVYGHFLSSFWQ